MKITAIQDTVLKKAPIQSADLHPSDKITISSGQSLFVNTIEKNLPNNHAKVTLQLKGWKEAFFYTPHWVSENGKNVGFVSEVKPKSGIISKLVQSKKDYVMQPDAQTCQSAAIAMITGGDVWGIRTALTNMGSAGDPYVMGEYIKSRVKEYEFIPDASLKELRQLLDQDYQIICHGWFSGSGHVIKVSGYTANNLTVDYIVDDPWNEFNAKGWTYAPWDKSGDDVRYSAYAMYAACVKGQSVYDAADIYNRGELDSNLGNMWVHSIKN